MQGKNKQASKQKPKQNAWLLGSRMSGPLGTSQADSDPPPASFRCKWVISQIKTDHKPSESLSMPRCGKLALLIDDLPSLS